MKIFLSYASEDRKIAEGIELALSGSGYTVFFDKTSLPPGGDYHSRIAKAVSDADLFIFLISEESISAGSYALTELKFARKKWAHPKGRILPVRLREIDWEKIPTYLKSITILSPVGNVAAETRANVVEMTKLFEKPNLTSDNKFVTKDGLVGKYPNFFKPIKIVTISLIILISAIGLLIYQQKRTSVTELPSGGIVGPDATFAESPTLNTDCQEITMLDYSKVPPVSKIIQYCGP